MSDLPASEVARTVTLIQEGHSYRSVSRALGVSASVVYRNVQQYRQTESYVRKPGQGRKRATSAVDDRFIRMQTLRNRRQNAVKTKHVLKEVRYVRVSERTVRRQVNEVGLKSYVPSKAPKLERSHRVDSLAFAHNHRDWTDA